VLFCPEHYLGGRSRRRGRLRSIRPPLTNLQSLRPEYRPHRRDARGIDLLLVDLQDAGARYFTFLFTTVEVMRAAARHGIRVVVLDRPDPIGSPMQGNVLDPAYATPVGLLAVPMRHGMTLGELTWLARADLGLTTDLRVVPVSGWRRSVPIDSTGLPFVPPSPNLRSLESLYQYPGLCLFEGTNLSVGRGSAAPFEQIGAPWLDTAAVLERVRHAGLAGVEFSGASFTPQRPGDGRRGPCWPASGPDDELCQLRSDGRGVHLLAAVRAVHGDRLA
jgi:uncharacterized protein YbbC (DUF1343 family)